MLSDEEKEIFNNLKEYMQSKIDNGYHKFIYNDLDWDFKCIDCINAIDNALKQSKEIEELQELSISARAVNQIDKLEKEIEELKEKNKDLDEQSFKYTIKIASLQTDVQETTKLTNKNWEDKIKAKIEEVEQWELYNMKIPKLSTLDERLGAKIGIKYVLQSLLEKE